MKKRRTPPEQKESPKPTYCNEAIKAADEKTNVSQRQMRLLREGIDRGFVYHED